MSSLVVSSISLLNGLLGINVDVHVAEVEAASSNATDG